MKKHHRIVALFLATMNINNGALQANENNQSQGTLYHGGPIITMVGDKPEYAEVLLVKDGKIAYVGEKAESVSMLDASIQQLDLKGRTLLPGFIDAHGHVFNAGFQKSVTNLLPAPDGTANDIDTIVRLVSQWKNKNPDAIKKLGWIIGFGYDDSQLKEKRHPTANELDKISTEQPVLIIHQSGHLGVMNHKGLELAGYNKETINPKGGNIRRTKGLNTPNGVLEEMAMFSVLFRILGQVDDEGNRTMALAGIDAYTAFGYTTAQEGRANKSAVETWKKLSATSPLSIDVAAYPDLQAESKYMKSQGASASYHNGFRIAGVKLSLDGSPQGKTAWLSEPYFKPPEGQSAKYVGYPAIPWPEERQRLIDMAFANNWQLLSHTNGDAAAQALIDAVKVSEKKFGKKDRRTVMIHAQTVTEKQLDEMKTLAIIPSFFSMHTYYWGDWHMEETLGPIRGARISPTQSALKRGMKFTQHHDAPVALPSSIMILHTTVNRISRTNKIIGEDQRVSPYVALKSITDWAAWQYFESDTKGTLEAGKLADLVILDKNPLDVDPLTIKNIKVLETIKKGKTVYKLNDLN